MKVFVYWNLHKKLWSVRAIEGPKKGRVIAHGCRVFLKDCVFKVSEAGRQRVLRERRKNVHAGVVGTMLAGKMQSCLADTRVTYNPYLFKTFVDTTAAKPIYEADYVMMTAPAYGPPEVILTDKPRRVTLAKVV